MERVKRKLTKNDQLVFGGLIVLLIVVVSAGVYSATNLPTSYIYIIEDMGNKYVYSMSPSSSEVVVKTIRTVKVKGGKLKEDCIFVEEDLEECLKTAARKIMLTEDVTTVEMEYKEYKYLASPKSE